jgi:hypothetical protein
MEIIEYDLISVYGLKKSSADLDSVLSSDALD